jgi:hypothetical protein
VSRGTGNFKVLTSLRLEACGLRFQGSAYFEFQYLQMAIDSEVHPAVESSPRFPKTAGVRRLVRGPLRLWGRMRRY